MIVSPPCAVGFKLALSRAWCLLLLSFGSATLQAASSPETLAKKPWFEAQSAHLRTFSYGPTQEVAQLVSKLEQFRLAYSSLAGVQAVASPPIVVMAFPDHEAIEPFLPIYQGKPANLAAFFVRGSDENLIVVPLGATGLGGLEPIFHEYTHLLLRHNQTLWPLWLNEGMAEIYATFEITGARAVRIGRPLPGHLRQLEHSALMPLHDLFAVTPESPDYNERQRQGLFYAQSWLLTHFLMIGNKGVRQAGLGQFTVFLRQGQIQDQAFTNAFHLSLAAADKLLKDYVTRAKFDAVDLSLGTDIRGAQAIAFRPVAPVEALFRSGDLLLRVRQLDEAQKYFNAAAKMAPRSPFGVEGLGILAADREQHKEAVAHLKEALQRGSQSFLAHYAYAREKYELTAESPGKHSKLSNETLAEIRAELKKSLALMPDFGPAHHLLGFVEMVQGEDMPAAEKHLERAIQLEPENQSYLFSLAQAQLRKDDAPAARRTLESLRRPYIAAPLRTHAEELLHEMDRKNPAK